MVAATTSSGDVSPGYQSDDIFSALQNGVTAINNLVTILSSIVPPSS